MAVVKRTIYCPVCNHLQLWIEASRLDGSIVWGPHFIEGEPVQEFLSKHPRIEVDAV